MSLTLGCLIQGHGNRSRLAAATARAFLLTRFEDVLRRAPLHAHAHPLPPALGMLDGKSQPIYYAILENLNFYMQDRPLFRAIRSTKTLKDTAVGLLTEKILSGQIGPGERLNESKLARQLRISRAPIREALQQLLEQGLVVNMARRGMFVVQLEIEDIQKINSIRIVLEAEALRLAHERLTASGRRKLTDLVTAIEKERLKPTHTTKSIQLDIDFHRTIWGLTGNEYLEKILTTLTAPLFAYAMLMVLQSKSDMPAIYTHGPLLRFVLGKSKQTAKELMTNHLSGWADTTRLALVNSANMLNQPASVHLPVARRNSSDNAAVS
jgi:DNA-binding GntR family transcriptional regulator